MLEQPAEKRGLQPQLGERPRVWHNIQPLFPLITLAAAGPAGRPALQQVLCLGVRASTAGTRAPFRPAHRQAVEASAQLLGGPLREADVGRTATAAHGPQDRGWAAAQSAPGRLAHLTSGQYRWWPGERLGCGEDSMRLAGTAAIWRSKREGVSGFGD